MTKLGQHFLISKAVAVKMVEAAEVGLKDVVLEIGPGKGILTEELLKKAGKVIAVEKDAELVKFLKEKFTLADYPAANRLKIIRADALKFNPKSQLGGGTAKYKIVANIPYYITSRFLRIFLESDCRPSAMTLMVQKEVAQRIVAKPPKMNLLAVSVQVFGQPKIVFKVSRKYFSPAPKVDSAVIAITDISGDFFTPLEVGRGLRPRLLTGFIKNDIAEKNFFRLVKAGFHHKRKTLKNNLKISGIECLTKCAIAEKARAENLTLENWACLIKFLKNN
jgi:16S rRNA (adenine1518-N6/adenine1519-N6)-dimethyltransferase